MLNILKETPNWIALDKPSGIPTIEERGQNPQPSLKKILENHLNHKIFTVHRLDKETSGIVLFAKNAPTHQHLSKLFESHQIFKTYLALVLGKTPKSGSIDAPVRTFGSGRCGVDHNNGKPSLTNFETLDANDTVSLLKVNPKTGRRHQIRVHLYSIGHPVLGDTLYGSPLNKNVAPRLMLHAWKIKFQLPGEPFQELTQEPEKNFISIIKSKNLSWD